MHTLKNSQKLCIIFKIKFNKTRIGEIFMFQKLEDVEKRYEELNKKISDPEIIAKQAEWQKYMKEHALISDVAENVVR